MPDTVTNSEVEERGLQLVYPTRRAKLATLELDASLEEEHVSECDIPEHPLETGEPASDHIRKKPDVLRMTGMVSNTPIAGPEREESDENALAGERSDGRAETAYKELIRLQEAGELFSVVTTLRVYDSMALASLSVPRSAELGNVVQFSATLKHVRKVAATTAEVVIPAAAPRKDLGKKAAKPANAEDEQKSSVLFKLFGG